MTLAMTGHELLDPFVRMLDDLCPPQAVRAIEQGGDSTTMWQGLAESGFLDALVPEQHGGAGLTLADVGALIAAVGARAVPLPVAETMVARALLADAGVTDAGLVLPDGPIALASALGREQIVPGGAVCRHVLLDTGSELVLASADAVTLTATGVAHSLAARLVLDAEPAGQRLARPAEGLRPLAAVLRALLIAGAGERLLEMVTTYANERVQFGKVIGRQQALQQNMAVMAQDVVAARIAAQLGAASGLAPALAAAATAKATASAAAARIAATAHAVHGAIGISAEHDLQLLTRRLHDWRLADGSEGFWQAQLGTLRLAQHNLSVDWVRANIFA